MGTGLALSGGGFRATLFHLGVVRFLHETDQNGVTIVDHQTGRRFELDAGKHEYEIEVTEVPDGVMLLTKKFTLTRGGKEIVEVRRVADLGGNSSPPLGSSKAPLLTFSPRISFAGSWGQAKGDFDGDGRISIAIEPLGRFPVGKATISVSTADLNKDGKLDLVVADGSSVQVSVLLGAGDGTFQSRTTYKVGVNPRAIAISDLNNDGHLDLAVANNDSDFLSVLLGKGDATFREAKQYKAGGGQTSIVARDFNADGKTDLAVTNTSKNSVSVLLNHGNGSFRAPVSYSAGEEPHAITAADLNNDGVLDLVAANYHGASVLIIYGRPGGKFASPTFIPAGDLPIDVAIADLNGVGGQWYSGETADQESRSDMAYVRQHSESLREQGVTARGVLLYGNPPSALIRAVSDEQLDFMVLGPSREPFVLG